MIAFAIAVPLFTAFVVGLVQGGFLLFDEIELANAAVVGSQAFAVARQPSCRGCAAKPYSNTINAIASSGGLQVSAMQITLEVGSAPCASDAACLAALNAAHTLGAYSTLSQITVTVTYPCPNFVPASWMALTGVCTGNGQGDASDHLSVKISQQIQ